MKKYFYLAAVSAMMLTACSSENDVVQPTTAQPTNPVAVQQQAVAFDTYLSGTTASTRAGDPEGVMTTDKLKKNGKGFGVFAFYHDASKPETGYTSGLKPNFMFNEHVSWSGGWTYSPLKYWPNETKNDSQDPAATVPSNYIDKLSFFAYAPYVSETATLSTKDNTTISLDGGSTKISAYHASETSGISAISSEVYAGDPVVEWKASSSADHNVDLLWGVAPAGLSYTAVNGAVSSAEVGMPILDMVKPDKDQKIKFLFQHALSRIGLSVVSAIDQIAAGDDGNKYKTSETRVLIDEVTIWGDFGIKGALNLNNTTSNEANWIEASVDRTASIEGTPQFTINATNKNLALGLRYDASIISGITASPATKTFEQLNKGVLPSEQVLMAGDADPDKQVTNPTFAYGKPYYKDNGSSEYVLATTKQTGDVTLFTQEGTAVSFTQVRTASVSDPDMVIDGTMTNKLYTATVTKIAAGTALVDGTTYYKLTAGTDGANGATYGESFVKSGTSAETFDCYTITSVAEASIDNYATGTYYSGLLPRYFMVVPSALPYVEGTTETEINVKIKYHVVTKDSKLEGTISNVENVITKQTKIQLRSGKSYNLKLILGLTSVKLDATVADWLVADDTEIWLPKNVD